MSSLGKSQEKIFPSFFLCVISHWKVLELFCYFLSVCGLRLFVYAALSQPGQIDFLPEPRFLRFYRLDVTKWRFWSYLSNSYFCLAKPFERTKNNNKADEMFSYRNRFFFTATECGRTRAARSRCSLSLFLHRLANSIEWKFHCVKSADLLRLQQIDTKMWHWWWKAETKKKRFQQNAFSFPLNLFICFCYIRQSFDRTSCFLDHLRPSCE